MHLCSIHCFLWSLLAQVAEIWNQKKHIFWTGILCVGVPAALEVWMIETKRTIWSLSSLIIHSGVSCLNKLPTGVRTPWSHLRALGMTQSTLLPLPPRFPYCLLSIKFLPCSNRGGCRYRPVSTLRWHTTPCLLANVTATRAEFRVRPCQYYGLLMDKLSLWGRPFHFTTIALKAVRIFFFFFCKVWKVWMSMNGGGGGGGSP